MSKCKLDHTVEDVKKKLAEQSAYLDQSVVERLTIFLYQELSQSTLNEIFHLLKKYDLASAEERAEREIKLFNLIG